MQRMQILFPEPQLAKLRLISEAQDRPVSELIRNAVEFWLMRYASDIPTETAEAAPVYSCGSITASADSLRNAAYEDRDSV